MSARPRIGWLCNSAIGNSETFLVDNLKLLQGFAEVKAFSGNRHATEGHPDVTALDFDDIPQKLHHVIRRKLSGKDVRTLAKRRRCRQQLTTELKAFQPDVLWIEFGTTAHVAADLLTELDSPYIITVHGFDVSSALHDPWYQAEFIRLASSSLKVVCASDFIRNKLIAIGVPSERCLLMRLPIHDPGPPANLKTNTPSFIHVGRLVEVKGPIFLIQAFKFVSDRVPEASLTIIGEGPLHRESKRLTKELGLSEKVDFRGALNHQKTLCAMKEHWAICQAGITSRSGQQEAFGLSLAEAAVVGLPVIATNFGGIPEHVQHKKTGFLVDEGDIQGLAEAMLHVANNPLEARAMGMAGRQNITRLCSPVNRSLELQQLIDCAS